MRVGKRQRIIDLLDTLPAGAEFTVRDIQMMFKQVPGSPEDNLISNVLQCYGRVEKIPLASGQRGRTLWRVVA